MRLGFMSAFVVVVAAGFLGGCAADDCASYVEPTLTDQESATVSGGWGYYITEVDGCRVDSGNIRLSNFGGNKVKVEPGRHEFVAYFSSSNSMGNGTVMHERTWQLYGTVLAGHHYQIGTVSLFNTNLTITDNETKISQEVQVSKEAMQTPEQQKRDAVNYPGD